MGIIGLLFLAFIVLVAVLGVIGLGLKRRDRENAEDILPEKTLENVADLNDRFNRARYQDDDREQNT